MSGSLIVDMPFEIPGTFLDHYAYAAGNPITTTDPLGLFVNGRDLVRACQAVPHPAVRALSTALILVMAVDDYYSSHPDSHARPLPRRNTCDACHDEDDGSRGPCEKALEWCLDNPWMPKPQPGTLPAKRYPKFGPKKDCGACYRECKNNGGVWPTYKCPGYNGL